MQVKHQQSHIYYHAFIRENVSETLIRNAARMTHVMFNIDKVKLDKEKDEYSW